MSLAETLASEVRSKLPLAQTIPVNVARVAHLLGVDNLRIDEQIVEDGRLECGPGQPVTVTVRAAMSRERRRFTLAHELGHLLLADPQVPAIAHRSWTDDHVERFCDEFAAALLIPREWVLRFKHHDPCLHTARQISGHTKTSMSASVARAHQVLGWQHAYFHWRNQLGTWRLTHHAGLPPDLHGRVRSHPTTSDALDAGELYQDRECQSFPILVNSELRCVVAELSVNRSTAVALIAVGQLAI